MSDTPEFDPVPQIAAELSLPPSNVAAVVALLAEGSTVPFIARYRKEVSGGMDEVQIRTIEERRSYLLELEERRATVLASIEEQGKLTDELRAKILACTTKAELEDLYLPYKPKRRTRAIIAREKGLQPLADRILEQPETGDPMAEAQAFISQEEGKEVASAEDALKGARDIVAEVVAETAEIRAYVRETFAAEGWLISEAVPEKAIAPTKFEQYYDFREAVKDIPSHRFLAIRRGESEGVLRARIEVDGDAIVGRILAMVNHTPASPFAAQLAEAVSDGYRRLLMPSVENDVRVDLKMRSDRAAVDVFADNFRNLLLQPPLGTRSVIGIDPGLRTGCKCAAVDETGKFLDTITIYLTKGDAALERARAEFTAFIAKHRPMGVAVGNGTGGRETEAFVRKALAEAGVSELFVVLVSEAGASVYSASDVAREEFPELDLTIRGAISIARRLQDPLAELVKIEPKAIGVGQYQHDVHQPLLQRKLGEVVESCVNHVGVELNTASAPLLSYVAGIGKSVAKKIVTHREEKGVFRSRMELLEISGLGPKAFQQCAGFLRIRGGEQVLDGSAVHPERYDLVFRIAADLDVSLNDLVGDPQVVERIDISRYIGDGVGEPTLRDIVDELKKPGRDPRDQFEPPAFREDVMSMDDLKPGMALEGVVTNVTAFGAFVDIGVHQDGLVHVSQLADRFVKEPSDVVKVGDKIKVKVLEVDLARKRIALTARSGAPQPPRAAQPQQARGPGQQPQGQGSRDSREARDNRGGGGPSRPSGGPGRPSGGRSGSSRAGDNRGGAGRGGDNRGGPSRDADNRGNRGNRGNRDMSGSRDSRDARDHRDARVNRDAPDNRDAQGSRDNRDTSKDQGRSGQGSSKFSNNPFAKLADLSKR